MARSQSSFFCSSCGHESLAWSGRCAGCGQWNTLDEAPRPQPAKPQARGVRRGSGLRPSRCRCATSRRRARPAAHRDRRARPGPRRRPDAGLAGAAGRLARDRQVDDDRDGAREPPAAGPRSSTSPVRSRRRRCGSAPSASARPRSGSGARSCSLEEVVATLEAERPDVCVIDSVQSCTAPIRPERPARWPDPRVGGGDDMEAAKRLEIATILVGHVTKEGALAGPRALEHLVDCVLHFEGERERTYRTLRALKNRFGATSEVGVFEMRSGGLVEVADPSARFVAEARPAPGSVVLCSMEGTRPLLVEIQALVAPTEIVPPRRDRDRRRSQPAGLVLAVLARHGGCISRRRCLRQRRRRRAGRRARRRPGRRAGDRLRPLRQVALGQRRPAARLLRRARPHGRAPLCRAPRPPRRRGAEVRAPAGARTGRHRAAGRARPPGDAADGDRGRPAGERQAAAAAA